MQIQIRLRFCVVNLINTHLRLKIPPSHTTLISTLKLLLIALPKSESKIHIATKNKKLPHRHLLHHQDLHDHVNPQDILHPAYDPHVDDGGYDYGELCAQFYYTPFPFQSLPALFPTAELESFLVHLQEVCQDLFQVDQRSSLRQPGQIYCQSSKELSLLHF